MKGGRYNAFNQHYKSQISDEVVSIFSIELNVNGNIFDLLERFFVLLNNYEKQYAKELDTKFEDCRDNNQKEKIEYIKNKLNMLPFHKELSKLN